MTTDAVPRAYATVTGPNATFTAPDGTTEPITATGDLDIRRIVVQRATAEAQRTGGPLELVTSGDRGEHHLLVTTTGELSALPDNTDAVPSLLEGDQALPEERNADAVDVGPEAPAARESFITATRTPAPAPGWRGRLVRAGIVVPQTRAQRRRSEAVAGVSRHWAGPRKVALLNGKGGTGKTMSSAMIAAAFARYGGGNVLAWDNNDTRGTLGWRTEHGLYDTTIRDLLPAAETLLTATASVADISRYVHHQSADRYDVLRSNPELLATDQRLEAADFDLLVQVATRFYRLIVFDSGNDESADRWLRMIDASDQLVIPTLPSPECAESAALLLEALRDRDDHSRQLADNAVVVVTQPEPGSGRAAARIADAFAPLVRDVETIPFDPALKSGALRFDALRPRTRDGWLRVAHAAATGLD
ncbi:MinD/ParA family ATP-binding protein [Microbacterium sp. GXF0217]